MGEASRRRGTEPRRRRVFSPARRTVVALWGLWERLFVWWYRLYEIPGDDHRVVRVGFHRWTGGEVRLKEGHRVRPGDWVGEIHLNNLRFAVLWEAAGGSSAAQVARITLELRRALTLLAEQARQRRLPVPAVAFYGKTLIHRGAARLGFEVQELAPTPAHRWLALYERWLLLLFHPLGLRRARQHEPLKMVWLPVERLVGRFGAEGARTGPSGPSVTTPSAPPANPRPQAPTASPR